MIRAVNGVRYTPSLFAASAASLALALFLLGAMWMTADNGRRWGEKLLGVDTLVIYLQSGVDGFSANAIANDVRVITGLDVELDSPEQAASELDQLLGNGTTTDRDLLTWSVELHEGDPSTVQRLAHELRLFRAVEDIDDGSVVLDRVSALHRIGLGLGWLLGALLVGASIFVVNVTVSLALSVRRDEIQIQKIVGASDRFIVAPLLLEAALAGTVGAVVALPLLAFLTSWAGRSWSTSLASLGLPPPQFLTASSLVLLWAGGIILSLVGTLIAAIRHLGQTE